MSDLTRVGFDTQEFFSHVYGAGDTESFCYGLGHKKPRVPLLLRTLPAADGTELLSICETLGIEDPSEPSAFSEDERRLQAMRNLIDCYVEDVLEHTGEEYLCTLDGTLHKSSAEATAHVQAAHGQQVERLLRQLLDDMEQDHMGFFFTKLSFSEFLYAPVRPMVRRLASSYPSAPAPTFLPRRSPGLPRGAKGKAQASAGAGQRQTASFPVAFGIAAPPREEVAQQSSGGKRKGKKAAARAVAEAQGPSTAPTVSMEWYKQLLLLDGRLHPKLPSDNIRRWYDVHTEASKPPSAAGGDAESEQEQADVEKEGSLAKKMSTKTKNQKLEKAEKAEKVDKTEKTEKTEKAEKTEKNETAASPRKGKGKEAGGKAAGKEAKEEGRKAQAGQGQGGLSPRGKGGAQGSPRKKEAEKPKGGKAAAKAAAKVERAAQAKKEAQAAAEKKREAEKAEKAAAERKAEGERLFRLYGEELAQELVDEVVEGLTGKLARRTLQQILKKRAIESEKEAAKERQRLAQERKRQERKQRRDHRLLVAQQLADQLLTEVVQASCAKLAATSLEDLHQEAWERAERARQEAFLAASSAASAAAAAAPEATPGYGGGAYSPAVFPEQMPPITAASAEAAPMPGLATPFEPYAAYSPRDNGAAAAVGAGAGLYYDGRQSPSPFMLPAAVAVPRAWPASPSGGASPRPPAASPAPNPSHGHGHEADEMEMPAYLQDELQELIGERQAQWSSGAQPAAAGQASHVGSEGSGLFSTPFPYFGSPENKSRFLDNDRGMTYLDAPVGDMLGPTGMLSCIPEDFGMDSMRCVAVKHLPNYITMEDLCQFFGSSNVDIAFVDGAVVPRIQFLDGPDAGTCLVQLKSQAAMQEALGLHGRKVRDMPLDIQLPLGRSAVETLGGGYDAYRVPSPSPLDIGLGPSVTGIGAPAAGGLPMTRGTPLAGRPGLSPGHGASVSPHRYKAAAAAVGSGERRASPQPPLPARSRRGVPTDRFGATVFSARRGRAAAGAAAGAAVGKSRYPSDAAYSTYAARGRKGPARGQYGARSGYYSPTMDATPPPKPTSWAWPEDDDEEEEEEEYSNRRGASSPAPGGGHYSGRKDEGEGHYMQLF